jgi:hypothetical protein
MSSELPTNQPAATPPSQATEERRRHSGAGGWVIGAVLVLIGILFLAQNISGFSLNNWWALFILIPAIGSLSAAWRIYQTNGRLTRAGRGPLIGGLILLAVMAIFLFNLNWVNMWPIMLIIVGIGIVISAL